MTKELSSTETIIGGGSSNIEGHRQTPHKGEKSIIEQDYGT